MKSLQNYQTDLMETLNEIRDEESRADFKFVKDFGLATFNANRSRSIHFLSVHLSQSNNQLFEESVDAVLEKNFREEISKYHANSVLLRIGFHNGYINIANMYKYLYIILKFATRHGFIFDAETSEEHSMVFKKNDQSIIVDTSVIIGTSIDKPSEYMYIDLYGDLSDYTINEISQAYTKFADIASDDIMSSDAVKCINMDIIKMFIGDPTRCFGIKDNNPYNFPTFTKDNLTKLSELFNIQDTEKMTLDQLPLLNAYFEYQDYIARNDVDNFIEFINKQTCKRVHSPFFIFKYSPVIAALLKDYSMTQQYEEMIKIANTYNNYSNSGNWLIPYDNVFIPYEIFSPEYFNDFIMYASQYCLKKEECEEAAFRKFIGILMFVRNIESRNDIDFQNINFGSTTRVENKLKETFKNSRIFGNYSQMYGFEAATSKYKLDLEGLAIIFNMFPNTEIFDWSVSNISVNNIGTSRITLSGGINHLTILESVKVNKSDFHQNMFESKDSFWNIMNKIIYQFKDFYNCIGPDRFEHYFKSMLRSFVFVDRSNCNDEIDEFILALAFSFLSDDNIDNILQKVSGFDEKYLLRIISNHFAPEVQKWLKENNIEPLYSESMKDKLKLLVDITEPEMPE